MFLLKCDEKLSKFNFREKLQKKMKYHQISRILMTIAKQKMKILDLLKIFNLFNSMFTRMLNQGPG